MKITQFQNCEYTTAMGTRNNKCKPKTQNHKKLTKDKSEDKEKEEREKKEVKNADGLISQYKMG